MYTLGCRNGWVSIYFLTLPYFYQWQSQIYGIQWFSLVYKYWFWQTYGWKYIILQGLRVVIAFPTFISIPKGLHKNDIDKGVFKDTTRRKSNQVKVVVTFSEGWKVKGSREPKSTHNSSWISFKIILLTSCHGLFNHFSLSSSSSFSLPHSSPPPPLSIHPLIWLLLLFNNK